MGALQDYGRATIAGDTTYGNYATIGGGCDNAANGDYASILGGNRNVTSGTGAGVISGRGNFAGGPGGDAVVAGGYANTAYGSSAAVGGGTGNYVFADEACVPGGRADTAGASYSFATNYHSVVGGPFTNSACFNSEYVTAPNDPPMPVLLAQTMQLRTTGEAVTV